MHVVRDGKNATSRLESGHQSVVAATLLIVGLAVSRV